MIAKIFIDEYSAILYDQKNADFQLKNRTTNQENFKA